MELSKVRANITVDYLKTLLSDKKEAIKMASL
jgi:hypothetical protein